VTSWLSKAEHRQRNEKNTRRWGSSPRRWSLRRSSRKRETFHCQFQELIGEGLRTEAGHRTRGKSARAGAIWLSRALSALRRPSDMEEGRASELELDP